MWSDGLKNLFRSAAQLVFPNSCLICDAQESIDSAFRHGLCSGCLQGVTADPRHTCRRCGSTVGPHIDATEDCVECRKESFGFASVVRLGPYEGRLRDAVLRMKTASGEGLADMMGRVFAESARDRLRAANADLVVPVPLHWRRVWRRGYNQSAAVARELAVGLGVPFRSNWLRRIRHTPQQVQPSAAARRENVRGAFRASWRAAVSGKRILLVDDVMTTGSTASEAAKVLRAEGAKEITVAILARR
jgi:ComF family protein